MIKRINNKIGGKSIRTQLLGVYLVAMVIPILVIGSFLVQNTHQMLTNYYMDLMDSDNSRVKNLLFDYTLSANNLSDTILDAKPVSEILIEEHESEDEFQKAVNRIILLDNYQNNHVEIDDIQIYSDNPSVWNYKQFCRVSTEVEESDWYQKAVRQSGAFWTSIVKKSTSGITSYHLCLVRKIPLVGSDYNAVLVLWLNSGLLRSSIELNTFGTFLAVGEENAFYSSDLSRVGKPLPVNIDYDMKYYQNTEKLILDNKVHFAKITTLKTYKSESKIYILTVNKEGYYAIRRILIICFVMIGLAIVLPGILIFSFTGYLTGRMNLLRGEMHKASMQDYELLPELRGGDEISEAYADLQVMVEQIKEHEAYVYESRIKEQQIENHQREMEYKMLASQINPHFLYNTLETIRMKAFTAGDREVAGAIKLLGKSMRYVLENTGTSETTLAKELEHVEVYLQIQQLRFGDRFDFNLDVEDGLETDHVALLPLMLQPVVENSVVHGLENMEDGGHILIEIYRGFTPRRKPAIDGDENEKSALGGSEAIRVEAENDCDETLPEVGSGRDEMLYIDIYDNGGGMDAETLSRLRINIDTRDVSRNKSIGLYNINQRLKMLYGDEYPLRVDAADGIGTRVRLTIPTQKCMRE